MYYVYLLISKLNTNKIYIGSTKNLKKRLFEHNKGRVIFTKRYMPWKLFYYEAYFKEDAARLREKRLKNHGNSIKELKKRVGLLKDHKGGGLPGTTFVYSKEDVKKFSNKKKGLDLTYDKSGAGFTLMEMLIVLTAFILMVTGVMYNLKINKRSILSSASQEFVLSFKEIQQKSLRNNLEGIDEYVHCPTGSCVFGINFDNPEGTEYRIFIDSDNPANYKYDLTDLILETKKLPPGLKYSLTDFTNLAYESPYGTAYLRDTAGAPVDCSANCNIELSYPSEGETINIKINDQGLVYIE